MATTATTKSDSSPKKNGISTLEKVHFSVASEVYQAMERLLEERANLQQQLTNIDTEYEYLLSVHKHTCLQLHHHFPKLTCIYKDKCNVR